MDGQALSLKKKSQKEDILQNYIRCREKQQSCDGRGWGWGHVALHFALLKPLAFYWSAGFGTFLQVSALASHWLEDFANFTPTPEENAITAPTTLS
jgi:hypothetical protein